MDQLRLEFKNRTFKTTDRPYFISPILNYGSEVWGFYKSTGIETVHLQSCKKLLGVKQTTQNDFIYGELGRIDFQSQRYLVIVKYWLKVVIITDFGQRQKSV